MRTVDTDIARSAVCALTVGHTGEEPSKMDEPIVTPFGASSGGRKPRNMWDPHWRHLANTINRPVRWRWCRLVHRYAGHLFFRRKWRKESYKPGGLVLTDFEVSQKFSLHHTGIQYNIKLCRRWHFIQNKRKLNSTLQQYLITSEVVNNYRVGQKNHRPQTVGHGLMTIILSNLNRFITFFHCKIPW